MILTSLELHTPLPLTSQIKVSVSTSWSDVPIRSSSKPGAVPVKRLTPRRSAAKLKPLAVTPPVGSLARLARLGLFQTVIESALLDVERENFTRNRCTLLSSAPRLNLNAPLLTAKPNCWGLPVGGKSPKLLRPT